MRNHALLSFFHNSGARIQEALDLCPEAIRFDTPSCVHLFGKGRKERICPALAGNRGAAEKAAGVIAASAKRADVRQPLRRADQRLRRPAQARGL